MNVTAPDPAPDTAARLLDAAERLFSDQGFAGTSVRQITDEAGANLGAVNYHFRSKDDLYAAVFLRLATRFRDPVVAAADAAAAVARAHPDRALRTVGRAFLAPHGCAEAPQRLRRLFAREAIEQCLPPGLFVREFVEPTIEAIRTVVRRIRPALPDTTARACAHAFIAQLMHIARGGKGAVGDEDEQLDHAVRFTVTAVTHLETARPRRSTPRTHVIRSTR